MTDPAGRPTIVADASFCARTRAAGWAAAVIRGNVFEETGAVLEPRPEMASAGSSNSAEAAAMLLGFEWAIARGLVLPGEAVLLATDSDWLARRYANEYLSRRNRARLDRGEPLSYGHQQKPLRRLAAAYGIAIEVCCIAGHPNLRQQRQSLRARVMATMDRNARAHMRAEQAVRFAAMGFEADGRVRPPPWRDTAADLRAAGALFLGVDA